MLVWNLDSDAGARAARSSVLRSAGWDVMEAAGLLDACGSLQSRAPDLVVLAGHPDAEQVRTCRQIAEKLGTSFLPVVEIREAQARAWAASDADACLRDPVEPEILAATVQGLLRARQATRELESEIEKRKLAEEQMRAGQGHYRTLTEAVPALVWSCDAEGRLQYMNGRFGEYSGLTLEQSSRLDWRSLSHSEDRALLEKRWGEAWLAGAPAEIEYRCRRHDGAYRWMLARIVPIKDKQDLIVQWVGSAIDITARKEAEEALSESEAKLRAYLESASQGIVAVDSAGRIELVNVRAEQLFGYSREEMIGMPVEILVPAQRRAVHRQHRAGFLADPAMRQMGLTLKLTGRRKDGSEFPAEIGLSHVDTKAGPVAMALINDVTERQQLEEQFRHAQKMEAVGRLAGGVAHDFNNLLTVIEGYGQLALEMLEPADPVYVHLSEVLRAADRACGLTNQLLAFSRRQVAQPRILDLNALLGDMGRILRRLIGEDVQLRMALASGIGRIKADPAHLEQVVLNLAVNARDAMPGGGTLTIETSEVTLDSTYVQQHAGATAGRFAMIAISDTGCGMDQETQCRMFEPFFTTKEQGKGTGLGLPTVLGIVQQSGGHIWVYSEPGVGTTLKIYLPIAEAEAELEAGAEPQRTLPRGVETILLVEDETPVRKLARDILAGNGYTVLEAEGVEEALAHCSDCEGPIHLVITDVVMPGASGTELAAALRLTRPEAKFLYMSGYTDEAILQHGVLDAGVAFLQKPFSLDGLLRTVRSVIDETANGLAAGA